MSDFDLGVIAEHRYADRLEVFCNRCKDSIGVMTFVTIEEACFNTMGRGGVLCPTCRSYTCDGCGRTLEKKELLERVEVSRKGVVRLCPGCKWDFAEVKKKVEEEIREDYAPLPIH